MQGDGKYGPLIEAEKARIGSPLADYLAESHLNAPDQKTFYHAVDCAAHLGRIEKDPQSGKEIILDQDERAMLCSQLTKALHRDHSLLDLKKPHELYPGKQVGLTFGPHHRTVGEALFDLVESHGGEKAVKELLDAALEVNPKLATKETCRELMDRTIVDGDHNPRRKANRTYAIGRILSTNPDVVSDIKNDAARGPAINSLPPDSNGKTVRDAINNPSVKVTCTRPTVMPQTGAKQTYECV